MPADPVEWLIEHGFHIHACCPPEHRDIDLAINAEEPCPEKATGKVPYDIKRKCHLGKWEQAAPLTLEEYQRLLKMKPLPNVGLKLGPGFAGGGLVRLDIDSELGEEHLKKRDLPLPDSWEFTSGRGRGILYRVPLNKTCTKNTPYENVELLGDGQQTVIPPSKHRRGTRYEWKMGHAPIEIRLAEAPDWIIKLMETPKVVQKKSEGLNLGQRTTLNIDGLERCKKYQDALATQRTIGLDEEIWFRWVSFLVSSSYEKVALAFSKESKKHDERSERRIQTLIQKHQAEQEQLHAGTLDESQVIHPVRCTSFGCDHDQIFECFGKLNINDQTSEATNSPYGFLMKPDVQVAGYRAPDAYFEKIEHPKTGAPPTFKFLPGELATDLIKNEHFIAIGDEGEKGSIYCAVDGIYRPKGEVYIRLKIEQVLGTWARTISKNQRGEVVDSVRNASFKWQKEFVDNVDLLPLRNGVLNWGTKKLRPYDMKCDYFFHQTPILYNPVATCPSITQWLNEVPDDDRTKQALIDIPAQGLYRRPRKDHFGIIGPPDSVKTFYANFVTVVHGEDNISTIPIHALVTNPFASAGLEHKAMNIYDELGKGKITDVSTWNAQTGGGRIRKEKKGIDGTFQRPYAKHLYLANKLPSLDVALGEAGDDVAAFFRRLNVIKLTKVFKMHPTPGTDELQAKDPDKLLASLTTDDELSGFLNLMIEALPRIVKDGPCVPASAHESMLAYMRNANSFQAFVIEHCTRNRRVRTAKKTLKAVYLWYCDTNELTPVSDPAIKKCFVTNSIDGDYQDHDGERERWWTGIKIITDPKLLGKPLNEMIAAGTRGVESTSPKPPDAPQEKHSKKDEQSQLPVNMSQHPGVLSQAVSAECPTSQINESQQSQPSIHSICRDKEEEKKETYTRVDVDISQKAVTPVTRPCQQEGDSAESACDIPCDKPSAILNDSPPKPTVNGKLAEIEDNLLLEMAGREEGRLKNNLGNGWPFVSGLIDDCVQGGTDKIGFWGAAQIRAYASRFEPKPSETIVELLANDVEGYGRTLKQIARARIIKAGKEAPR